MTRRLARLVVLGFLLVPRAGLAPLCAEPTPARALYVAGSRDIPQTVERALGDGAVSNAGAVVFAFEAASFAPPPGRTEFTAFYGFHTDVAKWVSALAAAAPKAGSHIYAMTSLERDLIDIERPAGPQALQRALTQRWASTPKGPPFVPAAKWMADAVRDAKKLSKATRVALVYLADRVSPERVFEYAEDQNRERGWRQRLLEPGAYFDEEAVGRRLAELGTPLIVVAPESHFEDFTPIAELPLLPWASRPSILSWKDSFGMPDFPDLPEGVSPPGTLPLPPGAGPGDPPPDGEEREMTDEEIEELVRLMLPGGSEEAKKALRELLRHAKKGKARRVAPPVPGAPPAPPAGPEGSPPGVEPPTTGPDDSPPPDLPFGLPDWSTKGRFGASTPFWFPRLGMRTGWANHVPSSYGHWPYARAASLSGGRYLFYPFPPGTWLDVCPTSSPQLADLAPELVKRGEFARVGAGDPAWDALDDAAAALVDDTPWSDQLGDTRTASGWGSLRSAQPWVLEKRWDARRRPCDNVWGSARQASEWRRFGDKLVDEVVPKYTRAIHDLDATLTALRAPGAARCHPRGLADLTLGRFWLALSRFHLHALGLYAKEIDSFKPDDPKSKANEYVVTYVPTIRMSDVLEAYDGRKLGPEGEAKYSRHLIPDVKRQQGNLLDIPGKHPDYRARRADDVVLKFLDPRLLADAQDLIAAARGVMEHYAKTPWGWTTYYTDVDTFVWHAVESEKGSVGPMGGVMPNKPPEDPDAPITPPGGGSTPGGPTTPGK